MCVADEVTRRGTLLKDIGVNLCPPVVEGFPANFAVPSFNGTVSLPM